QDAAGGLDGGRGHLRSPSTAAETARDTVSDVSVCWPPVGQARARAIMATAASPLRAKNSLSDMASAIPLAGPGSKPRAPADRFPSDPNRARGRFRPPTARPDS